MHRARTVIGAVPASADEVGTGRPCREDNDWCPGHHQEVHRQPRGSQWDEDGPQPRHVQLSLVPSQVSVKAQLWIDLGDGASGRLLWGCGNSQKYMARELGPDRPVRGKPAREVIAVCVSVDFDEECRRGRQ